MHNESMSLPKSHPLHQLPLRIAQVMLHQRETWTDKREDAYDLKKRLDFYFEEQIRFADDACALALQKQMWIALNKIQAVIDRYNFGSIDVRETTVDGVAALQHFDLTALQSNTDATREVSTSVQIHADSAFFETDLPWPLDATIRATPRRPGAPSFALRLNH